MVPWILAVLYQPTWPLEDALRPQRLWLIASQPGLILAAIGLGTALGVALYGAAALAVGAILVVIVVVRRRRRIGDREPAAATVVLTIGRRPAPAEPSSSSNDL